MWTTNVAREIIRREGVPLLPDRPIDNEELALEYGQTHLKSENAGVAVLKRHRPVPVLPRSVGIVTRRDVRDAAASYMRFMRASFDQTLRFAKRCLSRPPAMLYPGDKRLLLDYVQILDDPAVAVRKVCDFLGAQNAALQREAIAAEFSKSAVQSRIEAANRDVADTVAAGRPVESAKVAVVTPGNWRARDVETGFQTGHVSDYREGDWRGLWSDGQKRLFEELIGAAGHNMA